MEFLNIRHKSRGATKETKKLEAKYQKELFELQNPEVLREPTPEECKQMYDRSEMCSKAMFSTYKQRANQQWINSVKVSDWVEGQPPNFTGRTTNVKDVGGEFVKLYKMIFAEKTIKNEEWLIRKLGKHKILKRI